MDEIKKNMEKTLHHLIIEFNNLRTNHPNPSFLNSVIVHAYGTEVKISDLANISIGDRRQLCITPFDRQTVGIIGKSIEQANLGLLPVIDHNVIRVSFPEMSEDLRNKIIREAKNQAEKAKISIRDHRRTGNDILKKMHIKGTISEEEKKKKKKEIQELTDCFCKKIDNLYLKKSKDLLEI